MLEMTQIFLQIYIFPSSTDTDWYIRDKRMDCITWIFPAWKAVVNDTYQPPNDKLYMPELRK